MVIEGYQRAGGRAEPGLAVSRPHEPSRAATHTRRGWCGVCGRAWTTHTDATATVRPRRYTVQAAFFTVFSRLRLDGMLGEQTQEVLGVVDDFLHCVQLSVGNEVVHAMPDLEKALQRYGLKPI